jgi:hypothetical protein
MMYDYVADNYDFALRNTINGVDVYDKVTDKFVLSLTNVSGISSFEDEDGNIDEEKIFDAVKEEEIMNEFQDNMATYGAPT